MSGLAKEYKKSVSWRYATGRIRSLEVGLMGLEGQNRLFQAQDENSMSIVMAEYGYQQSSVEKALQAEQKRLDLLLEQVAPDDRYRDIILSFTDGQNLKTLLKEKLAAKKPREYEEIAYLMQTPSALEPARLNKAVEEEDFYGLPAWIKEMITEAEAAYNTAYDAARIDLSVDFYLHQRAAAIADEIGNSWFSTWLALKRDLINLETVLRSKLRKLGDKIFEDSLLPAGKLSHELLFLLKKMTAAELELALKKSFYHELAGFARSYGEAGKASEYSSAGDLILIRHIYAGGKSLNGPEVTLAYIFGRQMEMKNIRIALSALLNRLPAARVQNLRRQSYPQWR